MTKPYIVRINDKDSSDAIMRSAQLLRSSLERGDIILSGGIPQNFTTRFINIIMRLSLRLMRGISHSCIYLGHNKVMDIDHKIVRKGKDIEILSLEDFIRGRVERFGGLAIYAVRPRIYGKRLRKAVIEISIHDFIHTDKNLKHSYIESLKIAYRNFIEKKHQRQENLDLSGKTNWTCSHMVAYILKKAGASLGQKTSDTYLPSTFLFSKYFVVKRKVVVK